MMALSDWGGFHPSRILPVTSHRPPCESETIKKLKNKKIKMTALRTVSCPLPCLLDCLLACLTLTSNRHLDCYRSSPSDESHCHLSLSPFLLLSYPPACLTVSDTLKSIGGETKLFRLGPTRLLPGRESSSFHLRLGRGVLQMPCSCGSCGLY